jgi:hypothetical protein
MEKRQMQSWSRELILSKLHLGLKDEPYPSLLLMLEALLHYQKNAFQHPYGLPEPLVLSLGQRAGATTLIRAIKEAYPTEVVSVSPTAEATGLEFGQWMSARTLCRQPNLAQGRVVLVDGSLDWHPLPLRSQVRDWVLNGGPKWIGILGS